MIKPLYDHKEDFKVINSHLTISHCINARLQNFIQQVLKGDYDRYERKRMKKKKRCFKKELRSPLRCGSTAYISATLGTMTWQQTRNQSLLNPLAHPQSFINESSNMLQKKGIRTHPQVLFLPKHS